MPEKVLITGGSGLIGSRLTSMLQARNTEVVHLGRHHTKGVASFTWDLAKGRLDKNAFNGVTTIIHLAGASIAGRRWTPSYKREIVESRTKSIDLILQTLQEHNPGVRKFISASGIGYYGSGPMDEEYQEDVPPVDDDFLSGVVVKWEEAAYKVQSLGIAVSTVRTGMVLSMEGGALPRLVLPVRLGLGSPMGRGTQAVSWIHIDDLCGIYMHLVDNDLRGPFNAVATRPVRNRELVKAIAHVLHRPLWLPNVPAWLLKLLLGEMSQVVLTGVAVSNARIMRAGFRFQFAQVDEALDDLLGPPR